MSILAFSITNPGFNITGILTSQEAQYITNLVLAGSSASENDVLTWKSGVPSWEPVAGGAGTGDVVGPASAVSDRVITFDGTTGKLIKDSGLLITELQKKFTVTVGYTNADYIVDGTADNVQILAAINAVSTAGGGIVQLLEGTFNISGSIDATTAINNVIVRGKGKSTIIRIGNSFNGVVFNFLTTGINNSVFEDFSMEGNYANNTSSVGFDFSASTNVKFQRIIATDFYMTLRSQGSSSNISVIDCNFKNSAEITNSQNIAFFATTNISIERNILGNTGYMAINFQPSSGGNSNVHVVENRIDTCGMTQQNSLSFGIYCNGGSRFNVRNNYVKDIWQSGIYIFSSAVYSNVQGNYVENAETGIDVDSQSNHTTVENNRVYLSRSGGIYVSDTQYSVIKGNVVVDSNTSGTTGQSISQIRLGASTSVTYNIIDGNSCIDTRGTKLVEHAISSHSTLAANNRITNNIVLGSTGAVISTSSSDYVFNNGGFSSTKDTAIANLSGTNSGDQTSIVGITGTKAQFDTAVTDGNFMYVGDAPTAHTHLLAAGATDVTATAAEVNILDGATLTVTELNYVDGVTSDIQTQFGTKVTGPASATDNAVVRYDGTTGKLTQNSGVTILDTGYVGIGDTAPDTVLTVKNGANLYNAADSTWEFNILDRLLSLHSNQAFFGGEAGMVFKTNGGITSAISGKFWASSDYNDGRLGFGTTSSGVLTSKMVITGVGNVGIANDNPSEKLSVAGNIGLTGNIELGHASDTTISRVSAGKIAIEGVNVVTTSSTDTLTNKTLTAPTLTGTTAVDLITYNAARGKVTAGGSLGATETINFNSETNYTGTLDSNITFTFANATSGDEVTLFLTYDGTAQRTITYPTVTWLDNATGAAPATPSAAGQTLVVTIRYIGTTYFASATGNYAVYA